METWMIICVIAPAVMIGVIVFFWLVKSMSAKNSAIIAFFVGCICAVPGLGYLILALLAYKYIPQKYISQKNKKRVVTTLVLFSIGSGAYTYFQFNKIANASDEKVQETIKKIKIKEEESSKQEEPVNSIATNSTEKMTDMIFSDSSKRKLTEAETVTLNKDQLRLARNEIFARHGYVFKSQDLQQYFSTKTWYKPDPSFSGASELFNEVENYNIELLKSKEESANQSTPKSKKEEYLNVLNQLQSQEVHSNTGITSDMVRDNGDNYKLWDDKLNEIYTVLKAQLSESEMNQVKIEQRQWVTTRDQIAQQKADEQGGGTFANVVYGETLVELTKNRCYELIDLYMK